jgi:hypothetical protein
MQHLTCLVKILPAAKLRQVKPLAGNAAAVVFVLGANVDSRCGGRIAHKKSSMDGDSGDGGNDSGDGGNESGDGNGGNDGSNAGPGG